MFYTAEITIENNVVTIKLHVENDMEKSVVYDKVMVVVEDILKKAL